MEWEEDGEVRGNAFSFYNYNLILRLNWSFNDSYQFENRIQEETWPSRGNCRVPSPINSQLLTAMSAWWELLVHPRVGWGPHIPHASHCWQWHRSEDASRKPGYIWDLSLSKYPKTKPKHPKHSKMWLRISKPRCGAKMSMRLALPAKLPQELPSWQWSSTPLFHLSLISTKLGRASPCLPTLTQNQKLFMGDGVLVWDSLAEQNNLKIVWKYHWVVSICPYLSRHFLQVQTNYFFILDDSCTHHMCTSPNDCKLKTCKKQGKSPWDFMTGGNGSGGESMTSHHRKTFSSSRDHGKEWTCGQGHHHQCKADAGSWRGTCTAKLCYLNV